MSQIQSGILQDIPSLARYLTFTLENIDSAPAALAELRDIVDTQDTVVGFGVSLVDALGGNVPGIRAFPAWSGSGMDIPATQSSLWCWLRGSDRGELLHRSRHIEKALAEAFSLESSTDAFRYGSGLDLTGYEDGTENPVDDDAVDAAIVNSTDEGMNGSSFVAVQQWLHNMDGFEDMTTTEQDHTIGRRITDNEEIDDAPDSAHVKRTAQEDFDPEAFVVRRSMPWMDDEYAGLVFVAFGKSFDAFEALLNRMLGKDDGIVDALFSFTTPITGSYFWCPPANDGRMDLTALGLQEG